MQVKPWGTRGSTATSRSDILKTGGNTTCIEIFSDCLPKDTAFFIDGGTGLVPASKNVYFDRKIKDILLLLTHYHHDHTQGIPLSVFPFIDGCMTTVYGPIENNIGPYKIFCDFLFRKPVFPVNFEEVAHRHKMHSLHHIGTQVMIIHPIGGTILLSVDKYRQLEREERHIPFKENEYHSVKECLVIWMREVSHPDKTISFRIEEKPTGEVFVFMTDTENTDGISRDIINHLFDADLLIIDCQHSRVAYEDFAAGFGHSTPDYVARLAHKASVKKVALTHHDPGASDDDVAMRVAECYQALRELDNTFKPQNVFAACDYMLLDVSGDHVVEQNDPIPKKVAQAVPADSKKEHVNQDPLVEIVHTYKKYGMQTTVLLCGLTTMLWAIQELEKNIDEMREEQGLPEDFELPPPRLTTFVKLLLNRTFPS